MAGISSIQVAFPGVINLIEMKNPKTSFTKPKSKREDKALAAKKHSQAEKRRRSRINGQYATLRTILPKLIKTDKASVLAETIQLVTGLKRTVSKLAAANGSGKQGDAMDDCVFPSEVDELISGYCKGNQEVVKAAFSCEDRPELLSELIKAMKAVKGRVVRVVRAEMVAVGGRTKSVLWVQGLGGGNEGKEKLYSILKDVVRKKHTFSEINTRPRFHH